MPELNPRRVNSRKGRFAQIFAAVLAGMAAMFCLQNMIEFRRAAAVPAAASPAPEPSQAQLTAPIPQGVQRQSGPVPSSMLLKPEPGLVAGAAVVGVSGEEAPPRYEAPPAETGTAAPDKTPPHLVDRTMASPFTSSAVRGEGRFAAIKHQASKTSAAASPTRAAPRTSTVAGASGIKLIDKAPVPPDNLQAALIAQVAVPEQVFWTKTRQLHFGMAMALMIFGIAYLAYASGIRDEPPKRAEGEF